MKKEEKKEWDANTLCIPYYHSTTLPTVIHNACRDGWSDIGNTQSVSIPFLFLFFFHQSSLYPIKIFANSFYLLVCQPHMHARISMSELNEREDRSMIAHARDECARRVLFFSDIIYSGHYLESLVLFLWRVL